MNEREFVVQNLGEAIDRLVTLDIRAQGVIPHLYRAAREVTGGPLVLSAAVRLLQVAEQGSTVFICTGFCCPPEGLAETDGPVGSVVLARALEVALGIHPVILCEQEIIEPIAQMARCAGLHAYREPLEERCAKHAVTILPFTKDPRSAQKEARSLVQTWKPVAAVSVERPGHNKRHIYHMGNGVNVSEYAAKMDSLFELGTDMLTIGIGDLGNELGLGKIRESVEKYVLFGDKCQCSCGGGIAAAIQADNIIISSVSDWGAYALSAVIAFLTGESGALHNGDLERRLLRTGVEAGLVDGPSRYHIPQIDGMEERVHIRVTETLKDIVEYASVFPHRAPKSYELYAKMHGA